MLQILLIGLCAGATSALLFATIISGSLLSIVLFYLAPLPILIAAIGWTHWSALVAALVAATGLALVFNNALFLAFLIGVGLPAWWLGYLALLARPAGADQIEWYPVGHLVLWAGLVGALVVVAGLLFFSADEEFLRNQLRRMFERAMQLPNAGAQSAEDQERAEKTIDLLVVVMPPAAAAASTLINVVNLWLAGLVVRISGRLRRPWPDISAMRFPSWSLPILALAVAGSFAPRLAGTAGGIFAAGLLIAFALAGFAVLHSLTRNRGGRAIVLTSTYVASAVFGWPMLVMSLLGIADTAFDLRARLTRAIPPKST